MKMKNFKIWLSIALLWLTIPTYAYVFEVDGIVYETISATTVSVCSARPPENSNTLKIPQKVKINDEEYLVTTISGSFSLAIWDYDIPNNYTYSLQIPSSIESIEANIYHSYGEYTYYYGALRCGYLANIDVSPENEHYSSMDGVLFSKDFKILYRYPQRKPNKSYSIPEGVVEIFDGAISEVEALESIQIPNSVKTIGCKGFYYTTNIKHVEMSESIEMIYPKAFDRCYINQNIILPNSLKYIGDDAFYDLNATDIYCYAITPPGILLDGPGSAAPFNDETLKATILHVPTGTKKDYQRAAGWSFKNIYDDLEVNTEEKDVTANIIISGSDNVSINLTYPEGYEAAINVKENEDWHIYSVKYNGNDVTEAVINNTFTTPPLKDQNYLQIIMAANSSIYENNYSKVNVTRQGEYIHIDNNDKLENISIYNIEGKLIYQGNNNPIHVPESGVYIIRIGNLTLKLMI